MPRRIRRWDNAFFAAIAAIELSPAFQSRGGSHIVISVAERRLIPTGKLNRRSATEGEGAPVIPALKSRARLTWSLRDREDCRHVAELVKVLLLAVAMVLSASISTRGFGQEPGAAQQFVQSANSSDAAQKLLREGRELIGERKWDAAKAKFDNLIRAYPRDKNLDAALYWLAFCLKQQGKPLEADQTLERLIREYPRSDWDDDARVLRLELKVLGDLDTVTKVLELHKKDVEWLRRRERDDPDESLRLIALQSLFQADPERAMGVAVGFLSQDSKASDTVREAALGLITRHGGEKAWPLLLDTARNQSIAGSMREQAIYWIAHQNREQAAEALIQLYDEEKTAELKERLLYWLAHSDNERAGAKVVEVARGDNSSELRERAIYWIANRRREEAFGPLNELYGAEKDHVIKERILYWFAHSGDPRARAKVDEIARADASPELRERAIYWIAHRSGPEATDILVSLYDEQKEQETKERILYWLGHRGGKAGLQKLFTVARSDPSQSLRERAVYYLGQSKDPEAIKLIEQILK
jgi:HEAT repeat protein